MRKCRDPSPPRRSGDPHHDDDDLRHRRAHRARRVSGQARTDPRHEPVGVIEELGAGLRTDYEVGQRVIVGAITPCGQCFYCLNGSHSQCGGPLGGWRFGNTINGAWAEYLLVPDARANLAPIPDALTDEQVVLSRYLLDRLGGAETGSISVGDTVAVFAQGPIGLCATLGAKLRGAALIIGVDSNAPARDGAAVRRQRGHRSARGGSGRMDQAH